MVFVGGENVCKGFYSSFSIFFSLSLSSVYVGLLVKNLEAIPFEKIKQVCSVESKIVLSVKRGGEVRVRMFLLSIPLKSVKHTYRTRPITIYSILIWMYIIKWHHHQSPHNTTQPATGLADSVTLADQISQCVVSP